jgi:hypothetical protein
MMTMVTNDEDNDDKDVQKFPKSMMNRGVQAQAVHMCFLFKTTQRIVNIPI